MNGPWVKLAEPWTDRPTYERFRVGSYIHEPWAITKSAYWANKSNHNPAKQF